MNRNTKLMLKTLLVFMVIIVLLTIVEYQAEGSTIRNIWDAIWYSLITLTTVGYGDKAPVTLPGRILGIMLALCSVGLLSTLVGIVLHLLRGQLLPRLKLRGWSSVKWYVFNCSGSDAETLADELASAEDCMLIFPTDDEYANRIDRNRVYFDGNVQELGKVRGNTDGMTLILMKEDPWQNYREGLEAAEAFVESYCMADITAEDKPDLLHLFGREECLGRWYWKQFPLLPEEKSVVLIGCGRSGSAVLERALLTNVYTPDRTVEYHVFEDSAGFEKLHTELVKALSPGTQGEDSLIFHGEDWADCISVLRDADRIIICRDCEKDNLQCMEQLATWFGIKDKVHVRLDKEMKGVSSFGESGKILTRENVMKNALNRQAVLMHEIYNRGSDNPVPFEDLSYFLQQSNIAAADHMLVKIRYLLGDEKLTQITEENCRKAYEVYIKTKDEKADLYQEMEHRRWVRFHQMHNWTFSPVRNNDKRQHHLLLPYGELDPSEQKKDAYAWEMLGMLY